MLDTSVVLRILKDRKFFERIAREINEEYLKISSITVYELLMGAAYKKIRDRSEKELNVILRLIDAMEILPFTAKDAKHAAVIWAKLKEKGLTVNDADVMIAATAINAKEKLATTDKDFMKIRKVSRELDVVMW